MQRYRFMFAVVFAVAVLLLGNPSAASASVAVSISVFHEQLTPYGQWVVAGSYGNVWVPHVAVGWAPYVDGQWVYTDYGWTWVSNDPWGDVPCHYGSWAWVDPYGWVWTPGTVWAPAWVTWAYTDDYVGWAPIPPTFALSVTGYGGAPVVLATARYCFVPARQFVGVNVASVRVPVERNAAIFTSAVKTTNFRVSEGVVRTVGPPTAEIEKAAAHKIAPVSIARVKARPTTLAQSGPRSGSRVAVVAPAAEREHVAAVKPEMPAKQAAAKPATTHSEAPKTAVKSRQTRSDAPKSAAIPAPAKPTGRAQEKTTSAEHREAKPSAKPKANPVPKEPAGAEVAKKSAPKPAPKREPQAEPPADHRTQETHVASHETRQAPAPAPAHHQKPAAANPKAPEHPQPPKEEKPGE